MRWGFLCGIEEEKSSYLLPICHGSLQNSRVGDFEVVVGMRNSCMVYMDLLSVLLAVMVLWAVCLVTQEDCGGIAYDSVLCHKSPRWISLAYGQYPLYSDGDLFLYMQHHLLWITAIITLFLITPPIHLYFWLIFASIWAEPPMGHIISSFTILSSITSAHQKTPAQSCGSYHLRDKVWDAVEARHLEIVSGDKVPLRDNKGATHGNCIWNMIQLS